MHCPSCRHPLEQLILQGRATGAWQCLKCQGAWLQQAEGGALSGAWPGAHIPAGHPFQAPVGLLSAGLGGETNRGLPSPFSQGPTTSGTWSGRPPARGPSSAAHTSIPGASPQNPDWDVCSWCGKNRPGAGPRCIHCNIDRLRCPRCQTMLVGVRRVQVLVDLCMSCQGLWFERGRLETMLERLRTGAEPLGERSPGTGRPNLLLQLADFLEATEPGMHTERNRGEVGIWEALASTFSSGVGGSRRIVTDMLTLLGELPGPRRG